MTDYGLIVAIDQMFRDKLGEEPCYDCGRHVRHGECDYCASHAVDPGPLCSCGKRLMRAGDPACPACDPSVRRATRAIGERYGC